ncbi:ATP-binding protein [uncultured Jatrophihabitans sp.]|uniref:ATP-binding protein n=1 Tax=uncultured Jatrophihabitans sp. TaxID=1610747 RepID=UPI0035CBA3F7
MGLLCVRHETASAGLVRTRIEHDLVTDGIGPDCVADIMLVATELVGNAVLHAKSTCDVGVTWDIGADTVVIRVRDDSTDAPRPREAGRDATGGRGLAIVAALADEWGVDQEAGGKQVWARIPVSRLR